MSAQSTNRRSAARQVAVQALYQWLQAGTETGDLILQFQRAGRLHNVDAKYFRILVCEVVDNVDALEFIVAPFLDRDIAHLDPVERVVLLLATLELRDRIEIPYRVIVNEAIELTKSFGAQDSHRYINGVLDKAARQLRATEIAANAQKVD